MSLLLFSVLSRCGGVRKDLKDSTNPRIALPQIENSSFSHHSLQSKPYKIPTHFHLQFLIVTGKNQQSNAPMDSILLTIMSYRFPGHNAQLGLIYFY